jgi:hypothetical protein
MDNFVRYIQNIFTGNYENKTEKSSTKDSEKKIEQLFEFPKDTTPPDFWAPSKEVPIPFVAKATPKQKSDNVPIIIGVVVGIIAIGGIYYWYNNYGPGAPTPTVSNKSLAIIPTTVEAKIIKTKGGYFYY